METSLIQTRIDAELKNDATRLFENLGLDMSTAIKIFGVSLKMGWWL